MRYALLAGFGLVVANVALFLIYNKADSHWPAAAMGVLTLLGLVVGLVTVLGERFRGVARDFGWGLLGGTAGTVLLAAGFYVWLVDYMS